MNDVNGRHRTSSEAFWKDLEKRISIELGVKSLSPHDWAYPVDYNGKQIYSTGTYPITTVCENWITEKPSSLCDIDAFMKERISLIEVGFRKREQRVNLENENLESEIEKAKSRPRGTGIRLPGNAEDALRSLNRKTNESFARQVSELNVRLQQAGANLHYHNGFIQISEDILVQTEIEEPFWRLVSDPMWKNVDTDMKESLDLRDSRGRDPSWYAARALESTIKIISENKGWTNGRERGAHNYVDNLASKNAKFIEFWEADILKGFFTNVRNPFGHGPGNAPMPALTVQQTDWAIEFCMSWIKGLVRRY